MSARSATSFLSPVPSLSCPSFPRRPSFLPLFSPCHRCRHPRSRVARRGGPSPVLHPAENRACWPGRRRRKKHEYGEDIERLAARVAGRRRGTSRGSGFGLRRRGGSRLFTVPRPWRRPVSLYLWSISASAHPHVHSGGRGAGPLRAMLFPLAKIINPLYFSRDVPGDRSSILK